MAMLEDAARAIGPGGGGGPGPNYKPSIGNGPNPHVGGGGGRGRGGGGGGAGGGTGGGGTEPPDGFGDDDPHMDTSLDDLYPDTPTAGDIDTPTVGEVEGSDVTEGDLGVTEQDTGQADDAASGVIGEGIDALGEVGAEETALTPEQQVDAELARILGQDSPLMAQARANASQMANRRGLMNSSMAAGMTQAEMVKAATPLAQQNAEQALRREMENTENRQESGLFTAEQQTQLRALEAELGQDLNIFNAEQLNRAQELAAELRTSLEQGNMEAYNNAAMQLAELQRDAQAQQADIDFAADQQQAAEQEAYNLKTMENVAALNEQWLQGTQAMDLEEIRTANALLISTNEIAGSLWETMMSGIAQIFDDPKMTPSKAASSIQQLMKAINGSFDMLSEINSMDFGI